MYLVILYYQWCGAGAARSLVLFWLALFRLALVGGLTVLRIPKLLHIKIKF